MPREGFHVLEGVVYVSLSGAAFHAADEFVVPQFFWY